jgi:hypothetical protein
MDLLSARRGSVNLNSQRGAATTDNKKNKGPASFSRMVEDEDAAIN